MPSPTEIWRKFFEACELPSKIQNKYAETFTAQRIQPNMLMDLDKDTLRELGVDTLGDQIAILRYIKQTKGTEAPAFKLISSNNKEQVTTTHRDIPVKARATSSSGQSSSLNPRSVAIKKPQVVHYQPSGLRSDEILREMAVSSRHTEIRPSYSRSERPLVVSRRPGASPYSIVRQTQISAARDSQRRNSSGSTIRDRITYRANGRRQY